MNETQILLLKILANVLFSAPIEAFETSPELFEEAAQQAVYAMLPNVKDELFFRIIRKNLLVFDQHRKIHEMMKSAQIPYVILKGCTSARYYPEPMRRMAGDVDIYVCDADFPRTMKVMTDHGYAMKKDDGVMHAAFADETGITIEVHRRISGNNDKVESVFENVIEQAEEVDGMMMPSAYHHCVIMLSHMAKHFALEGFGLRHLCDWAVFADQVDVSRWETELKTLGLWKFARVVSLVCVEYLSMPYRDCYGTDDEHIVSEIMEDVLASGNFGKKDYWARCAQIKYIGAANEGGIKNSLFISAWNSLKAKATAEKKSRIAVLIGYCGDLVHRERKPDTLRTIQNAKKRKMLYQKLIDKE